VLNTLRLVSELQAAAPHAEVHRIHIDFAWVGIAFGRLETCRSVHEERHLDVDFFFTTLTDGLSQAQEARVWACGDLRDKEG